MSAFKAVVHEIVVALVVTEQIQNHHGSLKVFSGGIDSHGVVQRRLLEQGLIGNAVYAAIPVGVGVVCVGCELIALAEELVEGSALADIEGVIVAVGNGESIGRPVALLLVFLSKLEQAQIVCVDLFLRNELNIGRIGEINSIRDLADFTYTAGCAESGIEVIPIGIRSLDKVLKEMECLSAGVCGAFVNGNHVGALSKNTIKVCEDVIGGLDALKADLVHDVAADDPAGVIIVEAGCGLRYAVDLTVNRCGTPLIVGNYSVGERHVLGNVLSGQLMECALLSVAIVVCPVGGVDEIVGFAGSEYQGVRRFPVGPGYPLNFQLAVEVGLQLLVDGGDNGVFIGTCIAQSDELNGYEVKLFGGSCFACGSFFCSRCIFGCRCVGFGLCAAGCQAEQHYECKDHAENFFHVFPPI